MKETLASVGIGFLFGSVPVALILPRLLTGVDVRAVGSGNPGATNVWRASGLGLALLVAVCDIAKGAGAVVVARRLAGSEVWAAAAGLASIAGHIYSPWLRGRGGKGVATSAGVFAILAPASAAVAVLVFVGLVALTRYMSVGSLGAAAVLPLAAVATGASSAVRWTAVGAAVLVVMRHRANLVRLWAGTEPRLGRRRGAFGPAAAPPRGGAASR